MRTKTLWVQDEYLGWILEGRKTIEVRVGYSNIARLETGDCLRLNDLHPYEIRRIGRYASFEVLLDKEDPELIAPGMEPGDLLTALHALYPAEKEALGVIALEIRPLSKEIIS
jgi:ASC-1-like (ASCH) protein